MKKLLKKLFNKFGIEIHRLQPNIDDSSQVIAAMKKVNINVIFDIGANVGQFSSEIRRKGYTGKIISFEPLISAREILINEAALVKSSTYNQNVATVESVYGYEKEIKKIENHIRLSTDIFIAAKQLKNFFQMSL